MHGDDYCSAGSAESLGWIQTALETRYSIKTQRIGDNSSGSSSGRVSKGQILNRVVRRTPEGYDLAADLRHAKLVIEHVELENSKKVITPGVDLEVKCAAWDADGDEPEGEELPPAEATRFRAIGARCNYLQPDRPDIQYAVRQVCCQMSRPTTRAWEMLKRIGRYLRGRRRLVWKYCWQASVSSRHPAGQ